MRILTSASISQIFVIIESEDAKSDSEQLSQSKKPKNNASISTRDKSPLLFTPTFSIDR